MSVLNRCKHIIICAVFLILVCFTAILVYQNARPRSFTDFFDINGEAQVRAGVSRTDGETMVLDDADARHLFELLSGLQYYPNGGYTNVYTGNLYHITLFTPENAFYMIISDDRIAYIEGKPYLTGEESAEIIDFLNACFKKQS